MTIYKLVVVIEEDNLEQAEDHILSLSGSDLLEHLQEEEQKGKQWKMIEIKLLNNLWKKNYGD